MEELVAEGRWPMAGTRNDAARVTHSPRPRKSPSPAEPHDATDEYSGIIIVGGVRGVELHFLQSKIPKIFSPLSSRTFYPMGSLSPPDRFRRVFVGRGGWVSRIGSLMGLLRESRWGHPARGVLGQIPALRSHRCNIVHEPTEPSFTFANTSRLQLGTRMYVVPMRQSILRPSAKRRVSELQYLHLQFLCHCHCPLPRCWHHRVGLAHALDHTCGQFFSAGRLWRLGHARLELDELDELAPSWLAQEGSAPVFYAQAEPDCLHSAGNHCIHG
ncbi:uncharacterized protein K452DRAFT_83325 [Aplosporella prunicola CBS 121167]|uniref:Uncharacterized protein n=1 Tax=Aplosporella prunicola CBS 121167 TaxID=1176127 RepID=A0A6A6B3Q9_9PEZI|nr:uncharacterized protein K452DRAFT_83325 [Aplosporella prunicola CBS 121167]KAF2138700.1 hypothetical protein K452DRAFT_83325 [Aplosporella prunicola CBS 121167]